MDKAISFLKNILKAQDTIVVACSGGPDSMCLLQLLCDLRNEIPFKIIVAHVNHNLRKESTKEEAFVEHFCQANDIIFACQELDFQNKFSEQKGHQARFAFYDAVVQINHAQYLLTAHHGDDLMETILMRLTRGSNLEGYQGYRKYQQLDHYALLRPLIFYSKADILKYNQKHHIPYVVDKSNKSRNYTRNRYRQKVLPFLKKEERLVHLKYLKFSEELQEYQTFLNSYLKKLKAVNKNNEIDLKKLKNESPFIKRQVISQVIKNIQKNDWLEIDDAKVGELLKLCQGKNRCIDLNNGYIGQKEYDKFIIKRPNQKQDFTYELTKDLKTANWEIKFLKQSKDNSNYTLRLNSEELALPLYVRNRQEGDKMTIKNMQGTKKIKDILINEKVKPSKRDNIPLILDQNNNILWLPGVKKSKFAKNNGEKCDIILNYKEEDYER